MATTRWRGIASSTLHLCLFLIAIGSKGTAAQTTVSWSGCGNAYPALTSVGAAEDDCQDNKALTRCVLADNIVQSCGSCDKHNCCTTDGSDCSKGNCKSNVCLNPDPRKYLTTLMLGLTGESDNEPSNKNFMYGITEFETKMEFISQWTVCTTKHSLAFMQITFQNGTQVRFGNPDEFKADQCATGAFGPSPPIVTYAAIYKSDDDTRKKPGVTFKSDGSTIVSRKASSYNDQCSVNYPGSGLLVGLAGMSNTGEVSQLTPLFLRAIDSFTIQSTTLPAESDLNAAYTPAQKNVMSGFGVDCSNSTTECDFDEKGSATTGGSTSYTDMQSTTWGKVLSLGFSASGKVSMKKSLTTTVSAKLGVDGNVEGSWEHTSESARELTETSEQTSDFRFSSTCPAGCTCDYVIYQYQGQITTATYDGQYVLTLKAGGDSQPGATLTWDISKVSGTSGNMYNTSVIKGQPWITVVQSGSKCADIEAPPPQFGTPDTSSSSGRKLLSASDDSAPAIVTDNDSEASPSRELLSGTGSGSSDVDAATFIKRSPKPTRPKPCRNRRGKMIRCPPRPSPSPSPKPVKKAVRMYYSMEKRMVVYHNPDKPCPVYHAGSLPTSAAGQAALAQEHRQEWKHIAAAQRLLPAKKGMFVINRCTCKTCSDAAKGMA